MKARNVLRVPYSVQRRNEDLVRASSPKGVERARTALAATIALFQSDPARATRACVLEALKDGRGSKEAAAALLGMSSRRLYRMLDAFELHGDAQRQAAFLGHTTGAAKGHAGARDRRARLARRSARASLEPVGTLHAGYVQPDGRTGFLVRPRGADSKDAPVVMLDAPFDPGKIDQSGLFEVVAALVCEGWLIAKDGDGAELPDIPIE